jgi:methionyl-tRNA formyltransferase
MTRAVVFAYHNVGVRSKVLLAHRVDVALVVTHDDSWARTSGSTASHAPPKTTACR